MAASDHGDEHLEGKNLKATYWKDKDVSSALVCSQKAYVWLLVEYYEVLQEKNKRSLTASDFSSYLSSVSPLEYQKVCFTGVGDRLHGLRNLWLIQTVQG